MTDSQKYTNKLANTHVLVIGGSSGIGFCVAEASLESGARVTISSSQTSRVQSSIARLLKTYPSAKDRLTGHACDLSSPNLDANIKSLLEKAGKVDHIVYTAGDKLVRLPIEEISLEAVQQAGMVRFFGPLFVAKHARAYLNPGPASSYTLTTGSVSQKPMLDWSLVSGYAGGLHSMMRNLALELAPIRVNLVSPGPVVTELWDMLKPEERDGMLAHMGKILATGQIGKPEDVAEAYLFAMRDQNCTGTVIDSNGGALLK